MQYRKKTPRSAKKDTLRQFSNLHVEPSLQDDTLTARCSWSCGHGAGHIDSTLEWHLQRGVCPGCQGSGAMPCPGHLSTDEDGESVAVHDYWEFCEQCEGRGWSLLRPPASPGGLCDAVLRQAELQTHVLWL